MTDQTPADRWPEDRMHGLGDLARALGGDETSFTGEVLKLIAKAQSTRANLDALRRAFPRLVRAYGLWMASRPAPYADEFLALLDAHWPTPAERPRVVCLCGSTRFGEAFRAANLRETLAGRIVLSIGCDTKSDDDLVAAGEFGPDLKDRLDELHKRKIDLADEVLVLNVGGYIGDSTRSEIAYAQAHGKPVRYLEQAADPAGRAA